MTIMMSGADGILQLAVSGKHHSELVELVNRAANTWDTAPSWVHELHVRLNNIPATHNARATKE